MTTPTQGEPGRETGWSQKRIRALVAVGVVAVIALIAFLFIQAFEEESVAERWDEYDALKARFTPKQDPLWSDPYGFYGAERERLVNALENFIAARGQEEKDPLEPQARWRIAKTLADQILAMKDVLDFEKRKVHYDKAIAQLEKIQEDFPDYHLNWSQFAPKDYPSLTRQFLRWLEANRDWDSKYLPSDKEPEGAHVVVLRTTRGDLRMRLYEADAPEWTQAFLQRAIAGDFDGTAFVERKEIGDDRQPREYTIRGGGPVTRGAVPYDSKQHTAFKEPPKGGGLLPAPTRSQIPHMRGTVSAWHDEASEYDQTDQLQIATKRSLQLDYDYTPVGKLIDEASFETLDRIYEQETWSKDPVVSIDTGPVRAILDYFQAPAEIVKVLVYKDGALVTPEEGKASPSRVAPTETEMRLETLAPDAAKQPIPERPRDPQDEGDDTDGADDEDSGEKKPDDGNEDETKAPVEDGD